MRFIDRILKGWRWSRPLITFALTAFIASSCSTTSSAPASQASLPTRTGNAADSAFADNAAQAAFAKMDAPAFYIGIWDPQRGSFTRAYGNAVRGGANATTDDSLRIASITKTFTATVVLELADEGKLDLQRPITTYLPQSLASEPKLAGITVDQLLGMESGLADYLVNPDGIASQIAADPTKVWTPDELVSAALKLDSAPPGTPGYTNTNFVLLEMIAEQVAVQPLASLINQRLTGPLALTHTFLPANGDTSLPAPAAHGYLNQQCVDKAAAAGEPNIDQGMDTTAWNTSYFAGAAEMISTIGDLGAWAATNLGTDLLHGDTATARLKMHDIGGDRFQYGLGIKRYGDWYGHDGDAFGWGFIAVHDPQTGVSFVAATNACTGFTDNFLDLLQVLYPDQSTRS